MGSFIGTDSKDIAGTASHLTRKATASPRDLSTCQLQDAPLHNLQECSEIVASATNDSVRDLNLKTHELTWPQGLQSLLGYDPASIPNHLSFWSERIHPDDWPRVSETLSEAISDNATHWTGEYRFRHANGTYLHLLERAAFVRDNDGQPCRMVSSLMDVTERKQLQDQLCRSQRMEAFGQLAAGAAHDFNNFLTTILGYSDLVLCETGIKGNVARHIGEIRSAAGRASNLAAQLLAFSRRQMLEPQVVEINSLITQLERSLFPLLGENISVVCHLHHEKEGAHVRVDPNQLTQILLNLAVNARDAMPRGGQLAIETGIVDLGDGTKRTFPELENVTGEFVVIVLKDTGEGMSEDVKSHLFEPFFTTKDHASGLGLATGYGIIRQSGGHIRVESEKGIGTTIEIYLPKVAAPAKPSYRKPSAKLLPTGNETILVLEDDISVRHISIRVLRGLGYEVLEAANGDDAQRLITERSGEPVDLLLTDVVMPQMCGREFAGWLRQTSPKTKVVFVSGYLQESDEATNQDGMFFLPKPFDPEQLAQKIRHALDA